MNQNLTNSKWVGNKMTIPENTWVKVLDEQKLRSMLKICNQSHEHYLKIAYSEEDAQNGIYIPMQPDGLFDQTNFIPTNAIYAAGEGGEIVMCWWTSERDSIKL